MDIVEFQQLLRASDGQNILSFEQEFSQLMDVFRVEDYVAAETRAIRDDHKRQPNLLSPTALNLVTGEWYDINLLTFDSQNIETAVFTHSANNISWLMCDAECTIYDLVGYNNSSFDNETRIRLSTRQFVKKGGIIAIDANKQIVNLRSEVPISVVSISERRSAPYGWRFDSDTGKPVCQWNLFPVNTLVELMAKFLGAYGDEASIDCLNTLGNHSCDTVRWQAAASLACIDRDAGINAFNNLASSANPDLAAAARATLELAMVRK